MISVEILRDLEYSKAGLQIAEELIRQLEQTETSGTRARSLHEAHIELNCALSHLNSLGVLMFEEMNGETKI